MSWLAWLNATGFMPHAWEGAVQALTTLASPGTARRSSGMKSKRGSERRRK